MTLAAFDKLAASDTATPKRIFVCGDTMVDRWIFGDVGECQDGCPCFRQTRHIKLPGGAGNAARQLWAWRSEVFLVAPWPFSVLNLPGQVNSSLSFGPEFNIRSMPEKVRYVAGDGQIVWRHDSAVESYCTDERSLAACRLMLLATLRDGKFDAVLISDYDKGFLDAAAIRDVIRVCCSLRIPVVADAKREPELFAGAVLKVNADYANRCGPDRLRSRKQTVITHGAAAPIVIDDGYALADYGSYPSLNGPIQHVGAGDCFGAHLAIGLAHGLPLREAAAIAHAAGRVYVSRPLAQPPTLDEIRAMLAS